MPQTDHRDPFDEDLSIHIFSASATMLGICLTVIGLLRVVITVRGSQTLADDLLALDSILFLASCILSYVALRRRKTQRRHRLELLADRLFVAGLVPIVLASIIIVYQLI